MTITDLIGAIAATLTTVSFVPQALRIIKTRHTHDISLPMYALFSTGILLWLIYGILIGQKHWGHIYINTNLLLLLSSARVSSWHAHCA